MPRGSRQASEVGLYHVITRGNNKSRLFHHPNDFKEFLHILDLYRMRYKIDIHHYCLMTNHIHLLVWAEDVMLVSGYMHSIQRSYHHYYRKKRTLFGHLFQGRYRSLPIGTESYLLDCGRYIERNPVRAKLVQDPKEWVYSSYCAYAFGYEDKLISFSPAYEALSDNPTDRRRLYRDLVESTRPYEEIIDKELIGV